MRSRWQVWLFAPPRCSWLTGARKSQVPGERSKGKGPNEKASGLGLRRLSLDTRGFRWIKARKSALRLLGFLSLFCGFLGGLLGRFLRRRFFLRFLGSLFGFFRLLLRRLFHGLLGSLLGLLDDGLGGFFRRVSGTAHRVGHRFQNRFLIVHVVPQELSKRQR